MNANEPVDLQCPDPVPAELAGKWVAWDEDAQHIVATGDTWHEALANARACGVAEPYLDKAPPAGMGFIGSL
jgi:hypothetical protein